MDAIDDEEFSLRDEVSMLRKMLDAADMDRDKLRQQVAEAVPWVKGFKTWLDVDDPVREQVEAWLKAQQEDDAS